jgi:hypothetical protein
VWHESAQELGVFDGGAYDKLETAEYSRGMRIRLGLDSSPPTAKLVQPYIAPQRLLAQSHGSIQLLSATDTVLVGVGWGHIHTYTEFDSTTGTPLCDVHLCPHGFRRSRLVQEGPGGQAPLGGTAVDLAYRGHATC